MPGMAMCGVAEAVPGRPRSTIPDLAEAHYNLGLIDFGLGDTAKAAREFSEALSIDPSLVDARFQLAAVQSQEGRLAAAVATLRELIRRNPDNAEAYNNLGLALLAGSGTAGRAGGAAEGNRAEAGLRCGSLQPRGGAAGGRRGLASSGGVRGGFPPGSPLASGLRQVVYVP